MKRSTNRQKLRCVCECAVFTAAALALSFLKIPIGQGFGGFGGSIDFVMLPLVICAVRWGAGWGVGAGLIFGTLKFFFAGGVAVNWQSMLADYTLAYAAVGLAGIVRRRPWGLVSGGIIGCLCRFVVHYLSGVTIYAMYMPESFMELTMTSPLVWSALYNGTYMLPNTIIVIVAGALLTKPLRKFVRGEDLKSA